MAGDRFSSEDLVERWEVAYRALRQLILGGQLRPGERVREIELADRFGVSRGPVREALRVLENEGLILRKPRMGSFVIPLTSSDSRDIYELRTVIEPLAIQLSLKRHPAEVALALKRSLETMRQALSRSDYPAIADEDLRLHSHFYEWSDNERLRGSWENLKWPMHLLVVLTGGHDNDEWREVVEGHVPIVDAAAAGDIDGCVASIRQHLDAAQARIVSSIPAPTRHSEVIRRS